MGLKYYNDLLDIVNEYHDKKPDTSIETCKAIIEGISKLIIHKLTQEPIHVLDKSGDLKDLAKRALEALNKEHSFFDVEISRSLINVIRIIGEIRNNHCDIGHGRASVKEQINCSDLSQMIAGVTDNVSTYLLKKLDEVTVAENAYEAEQMELFNNWLDDNAVDFPIVSERFSKILYLHEPDSYYLMYYEFKQTQEDEKEVLEQETIPKESSFEAVPNAKNDSPSKLIDTYLSDNHLSIIKEFTIKEELDYERTEALIKNLLYFDRDVFEGEAIDILKTRPSLKEIKEVRSKLIEKINFLISVLKPNS